MTETADPLKAEIKQAIVRSLRLPIRRRRSATPRRCSPTASASIRSTCSSSVLELERSFGVAITDEETGMQVLRSVDTIAEFILAAAPQDAMTQGGSPGGPGPAHADNAFTVDLEEWFHVCGVGGALAFERWDELPSRVVPTTRLLLDLLDRAGVRATFFVVGWVAERHPRLVEAVRDAGHEIGSHGYGTSASTSWTVTAFRRDLRASVGALNAAGVAACAVSARRSGRSTTGRYGRSTRSSKKGSRSTRAWRR